MKIWIDFINTPQVSFWIPFIKELRSEGHEIILTCRDSGNTVALLQLHGLTFEIIGESVGIGLFQKIMFFPNRILKLAAFIRKNKPDIAASQSSFYQPIVSRILGIPCLYTNDNEHAKGNQFGFLFAKKIILPIAFQHEHFTRKWPLRSKVSFYPSVKEAIYLSQQPELLSLVNTKKNVIYFRPEPWSAQYYDGPQNFFDQTLLSLAKGNKIVILPRDKNQASHYLQAKFEQLRVAEKPLSLKEIITNCKLFIGAGGSMTRELAVMGIPVISIYQAETLHVDKYLVEKGCMEIRPDISYEEIKAILEAKTPLTKDMSVLDEGKESYEIIKNILYTLKP